MASRVTWQVGSLVFILGGIFGKFGALLAMVPEPVVAAVIFIGLSMCFSIAIANLEHLDIHSGRNQMILGIAMVSGVCFPMYIKDTPDAFQTGKYTSSMEVDHYIAGGWRQ